MTPRLSALAFVAALLVGACASQTTLSDVWVAEGVKASDYRKILVVAITPDPARRVAFEDAMSRRIAGSTPSHALLTLAELTDRAKVQARLKADGFDGALVVRLLRVEIEESTMPGHASVIAPSADTLYGYWDPTGGAWDRDLVLTSRRIALEVQFFEVATAERKFRAQSSSYNPADQDALADGLFDALHAELARRGVLQH